MPHLIELSKLPGTRISLLLVLYSLVLSGSYWLAYQIRFDFDIDAFDPSYWDRLKLNIYWVVVLKLALLFAFGQFSGLLSYFSLPDLRRLTYVSLTAAIFILLVNYF